MPYITSWERIARKKAIKEKAVETAKKMLMDDVSIETIIKYTGLAKIELKRLMQGTAIPLQENR